MIPESFIEELKYASGIEQIVSSYVTLKRAGSNTVGLCPFHSEKTPSFTVFPDNQNYYCFGCGKGGDVITFIRDIENLEYVEAIRFLAERAGLTVPDDAESGQAARLRTRILEMNREAARFFHEQLNAGCGAESRAYLSGRGLSQKMIRRFGVGFAPEGWDNLKNHLKGKGFNDEEMLSGAVIGMSKGGRSYDLFRNRIIFPIIDLRGNVIAFGGRVMDDGGPKYLNSPDTPVFKKSRNLFALNFAKSAGSDTLILGEGYMDVIAMHQAGFENAVATLGTSLTSEQTRLCAQYASSVVIAYDSDGAGQNAAKRAINLFSKTGVSVSVLQIDGAKDPDEYIQKYGVERFRHLLGNGKSAIHFEIDKLRARYSLGDSEQRVLFLGEFCSLMADIDNGLARDVYIGEMANELGIGRESVLATVNGIRKRKKRDFERVEAHNLTTYAQDNLGTPGKRRSGKEIASLAAEEQVITMLMRHPDFYASVKGRLSPEDFTDSGLGSIFGLLCQRLDENLPLELIHLSGGLDTASMGKLTALLLKGRELQFYKSQADEYIQAIRKSKSKASAQELSRMTPAEYEEYIASLRSHKK